MNTLLIASRFPLRCGNATMSNRAVGATAIPDAANLTRSLLPPGKNNRNASSSVVDPSGILIVWIPSYRFLFKLYTSAPGFNS